MTLKKIHFNALIFFFTYLCLFGDAASLQADYRLIEDQAKTSILSPDFSKRETLKMQLSNGLQVYLVSDPQANKSSAAMVVNVGSWNEPGEYPGIAHFLEHMLFLGTKKYPRESEFEKFLSEHGGMTNAFTAPDFTAFVFTADPHALDEAIDRFSSFFKEPLFNPSGMARELQAIDQEYAKNVENDDIRQYYVQKELCTAGHPHHAFSMGNSQSLAKVSQETLKRWYQENYSANLMRLTIISEKPLDQLRDLAIEKFKDIPNHNLPSQVIDVEKIPSDLKGSIVFIEPITHMRRLSLNWELPVKFAAMSNNHSNALISQVLGHEGKGSLLSELRRKKLAENLSCTSEKTGACDLTFTLEIDLTDKGVKELNQTILHCFQAIAHLKQKGIPDYLFDDIKRCSMLSYQYQERENDFQHIMKEAAWIAREDMSTYPERTLLIQHKDDQSIQETINLLTPENCIFNLIAPPTLTKTIPDMKERWLGVSYTIKPLPKELLSQWASASPLTTMDFPERNSFIPEKLSIIGSSYAKAAGEALPHPDILADHEMIKAYFATDRQYQLPFISWKIEIKTPSVNPLEPVSLAFAELYVKDMNEMLSECTFPASLAGLEFALEPTDNGLLLTLNGFNDKADKLFFDVIKVMRDYQPREQKFKVLKSALLREYQNFQLENPVQQALDVLQNVIYQAHPTSKEKGALLRQVSFETYDDFVKSLFDKIYLQAMLYGNMSRQVGKDFINRLLSTFSSSQSYPKKEHFKKKVVVLPMDEGPFLLEAKSKSQGNVAILAIEYLPYTFEGRAAQQVLMQAMHDSFFHCLRTKQQTGYLVFSQPEEFERHLFNTFLVQSNTHDPRDLLARFELFIEGYIQEEALEIPIERFENIKQALLRNLQDLPKNMGEMTALLYRLAFKYDGDFSWLAKRIQGVKDLSYDHFLTLTKEMMGKQNKRRLGLLLNGAIPENQSILYQRCNKEHLQKQAEYS